MKRTGLTEIEMRLQADLLTGRVSPLKARLLKPKREMMIPLKASEDRIARLEAEFAELKKRIEALENLLGRNDGSAKRARD